MKKILFILLISLSVTIYSLDEYIGYTPAEIIATFGAPDYIYSDRGAREEEDDIIMFYENRLYIYLNQNRVWQLRVDENFKDSVLKVNIGDKRDTVLEILGEPYKTYDDSTVYQRPDAGFPIFLRIYYNLDKVNDIYLFRGDY